MRCNAHMCALCDDDLQSDQIFEVSDADLYAT
jgi:hypothetical protein